MDTHKSLGKWLVMVENGIAQHRYWFIINPLH